MKNGADTEVTRLWGRSLGLFGVVLGLWWALTSCQGAGGPGSSAPEREASGAVETSAGRQAGSRDLATGTGAGVDGKGGAAAKRVTLDGDPIRYELRFVHPERNVMTVEAYLPTDGRDQIAVMMPVWTPGSYMVREYARNITRMSAHRETGEPLPLEKIRKNRWQVTTHGAKTVKLSYTLYAHAMSVRSNWVEADFAILNGASTFVTLADGLHRQHDVRLHVPSGWSHIATGLPSHPSGRSGAYRAANFDILVDSPILAGKPHVARFQVAGKPHEVATIGHGESWDPNRAAADTKRIVEANAAFWGELPYDRYVFLNALTEVRSGLEHLNSTLMMASRWAMRDRDDYIDWLGLMSHEFFHTWNVKRLRPQALGPFDYEKEIYTRSLWVSEGLTSYYDDVFLRRAGLVDDDEYFELLSKQLKRLHNTPGRLVQPLEMASYDAWIKYYRRDENSKNVSVSYYTKGAVVGWLLDAKIRQATGGARSLDHVMQEAYRRFGGGVEPSEARQVATGVLKPDETVQGFTPEAFRKLTFEIVEQGLAEQASKALAVAKQGTGLGRGAVATAGAGAGTVDVHVGAAAAVGEATKLDPQAEQAWQQWFVHALESTEELDYAPALAWYGLRFKPATADDDGGASDSADARKSESAKPAKPAKPEVWLGAKLKTDHGRAVVSEVVHGAPAALAGINPGDELIGTGSDRIQAEDWEEHIDRYAPGDRLDVLVARRGRLTRMAVTLAEPPSEDQWALEIDPKATPEQTANLRAWLGDAALSL